MTRFGTVTLALVLLAALRAAAQTPGTGAISGALFDPARLRRRNCGGPGDPCRTHSKNRRRRGLSFFTFAAGRLRRYVRGCGICARGPSLLSRSPAKCTLSMRRCTLRTRRQSSGSQRTSRLRIWRVRPLAVWSTARPSNHFRSRTAISRRPSGSLPALLSTSPMPRSLGRDTECCLEWRHSSREQYSVRRQQSPGKLS
jgi:hypothetical protein